jgi:hypothetical protein
MNNSEKFNDVLNECLDRMLKGETVEQCLKSYPEMARELEPLLHTAQVAKMASSIQPRAEFKAKARYEFQAALRDMQAKKSQRAPWFQWHWRWQSGWAIALVAIVVVVLSGGGTVFAASNSMPDDTLYPVKLAAEHVQLALTFSDVGKAELNAKLADTRVDEIINMAAKGDTQKVMVAAQNLNNNLQNLTNLAGDGNGNMHQTDTASGKTGSTNNSIASNDQQSVNAASAPAPAVTPPPVMVPGALAVPSPSAQTPLAQPNQDVTGGGNRIYPAPGASNVPQRPVFQWSAVQGAVSYDFELADNPTFVKPVENHTGLKNTVWTETRTLDRGKTYYWRVRAVSASGAASDWVASAFTIAWAPSNVPTGTAVVPAVPAVTPNYTLVVPTQPAPTYKITVPPPATGTEAAADSSGTFNAPAVSSQESANSQNKSSWSPSAGNSNNSNNRFSNDARTKDKEKIRQIIIDNAVSYQAKLEAALNKAPAQVRPALRQAITQSQVEVDKALSNLDQAETDTATDSQDIK